MPQICQACESVDSCVVESCDDPGEPYQLCESCYRRLHARALRPLEWYNLAKRYGWSMYLLHDDFYTACGEAMQPTEPVESPDKFPAPSLEDAAGHPATLLDYAITRWNLKPELIGVFEAHSRTEVLKVVVERYVSTVNPNVRSRILEVCAAVLKEAAASLVGQAWSDYPSKARLGPLAEASAGCLAFRAGFDKVVAALAKLDGKDKCEWAYCLGYFHSPEGLDWLETNVCPPLTGSWGILAAVSQLDWQRVENWIDRGRPLSLVALDALVWIARPRNRIFRTYKAKLLNPPERARFEALLAEYAKRDNVPRVQNNVTGLIANAELVLNPG